MTVGFTFVMSHLESSKCQSFHFGTCFFHLFFGPSKVILLGLCMSWPIIRETAFGLIFHVWWSWTACVHVYIYGYKRRFTEKKYIFLPCVTKYSAIHLLINYRSLRTLHILTYFSLKVVVHEGPTTVVAFWKAFFKKSIISR